MDFVTRLNAAWSKNNSLLCVGLDSDVSKLPRHLMDSKYALLEFNKQIIDATAHAVCAFKPQIAFYSAVRAEEQLETTIEYIHNKYPDILVILDAKRGDVGNTAKLYAVEAFERYKADAVTVNPFLGLDSLQPFLERKDKGVIILTRTSNPGAKDFQDIESNGKTLYQTIAHKAATQWNTNSNVMLVVGATYPKELKEVRALTGDMPFLVPGIGAQGGDVEAAVTNGVDSRGTGMIINSSRAILYASSGEDFAKAAGIEAEATNEEINRYRGVLHGAAK
jgi:orotidine-5'-phosphate decarboxylase